MRRLRLALGGIAVLVLLAWLVAWPRPDRITVAVGPSECPAEYTGDDRRPMVPRYDSPEGFSAGGALVPDEAPERVLLCQYAAGDDTRSLGPPRPLSRSLAIESGMGQVADDLSAAPRVRWWDRLRPASCSDVGGEYHRYLAALDYPTGRVWVAADYHPSGCQYSSNGRFFAGSEPAQHMHMAMTQGAWVAPTQGRLETCDGPVAAGREGEREEMLPAGATSFAVCEADPFTGADESGVFAVEPEVQTDLVTELAAMEVAPGERPACRESAGRRYTLIAKYPQGADMVIDVYTDCDPGVGNGAVVGDASDELLELLERATTSP